jgi:hypothetical protein
MVYHENQLITARGTRPGRLSKPLLKQIENSPERMTQLSIAYDIGRT